MVNEYVERIKRMRNDYNNWCLNNNTGDNRDYWDEDTREDVNDWDENEEYDEMSDAHVSDCAATIASAYRNNGDYAHMWEALAEATNHNGDDHSELTHNIMWETISELGWDQYPMSSDVFNNDTFKRMVTETCGGLRITPLSTLLTFLTESTDDETNLTSKNRMTVIRRVAHTLLAINPTIHDHAVGSLGVRLPYTRHYYVEEHILGAPRGEHNALSEVGRQALQNEIRPGHAFRYARQFAPEPTIMQEMADAAAWWRDEITRTEQSGDSDGEVFARRAHAHAALTLMHGGALPHSDLATLIDTMKETEETGGHTKSITIMTNDWTYGRPYNKITLTSAGALIDEAAGRMETR